MPTLATSSWTDAEALAARVLVVPLGATEQHGPHLPLTTDCDIAVALAEHLLAALPNDVVIAPPVPFGSSGEHQSFAGTIGVGQAAIEEFLVEIGRSATCTWNRILLLSTHGGNVGPVLRAARRLQSENRDVRAWMPAWGGDAHAGRTETSLMLAIDPHRVDVDVAQRGATEPIADLMPRLMLDGVAAVSNNGVLGDPTGASAGEGQQILAAAVASLSAAIVHWPIGTVPGASAA
jgi:mycofactocin precursor peptide peptidase